MPNAAPVPDVTPKQRWISAVFDRRVLDVDRLIAAATTSGDEVARCCAWLAVERQAARYLLALQPYVRADLPVLGPKVSDVVDVLEGRLAQARAMSAPFSDDIQAHARAGLGLRVAVVGKGGSGKTVIAGTLSRLLGQRGRRVLAADLDANPGLAYTLGLGATEAGLPDEALEAEPGADYGWHLAPHLNPIDVVERFTTTGPDGVRYLGLGKISAVDRNSSKRSVGAVVSVLRGFGEPGWDVIGDLEGGPTTPFERYHSFADLIIVVVNPSWVSRLTARRLLKLVNEGPVMVVANGADADAGMDSLAPVLRIPVDPGVAEAERRGLAPIDFCPDGPAVQAVSRLADLLT